MSVQKPATNPGKNGLPMVVIQSPNGSTSEIYTHGAHVTSWKTSDGHERIFLSEEAIFAPPTAIRGGVPICFPNFSDIGPSRTAHGYARNSEWQVVSASKDAVTMRLDACDPCPCIVESTVTITDTTLEQELKVINASDEELSFNCALHTYFCVDDISTTRVHGLHGTKYLDSLQGRSEFVEESENLEFTGEVDRIYLQVSDDALELVSDSAGGDFESQDRSRKPRILKIEKFGFQDAVVWNPYIEKSKRMKDFGDEEWKRMVCIEVAQASSGAIRLTARGEQWTGGQRLHALS